MKEGCVHEGGVCIQGRGVYTREGCVHEGGVCTQKLHVVFVFVYIHVCTVCL